MNRRSILVGFIFTSFLFSCISFDKSKVENLRDGEVVRIGHGGSGFASWMPFNAQPINSMSSFKKALIENAADGVEIDLQMTADFEFILYHDINLNSKTNKEGCIAQLQYKDIVNLPYELGFPFDWFQDQKIIDLNGFVDFCKSLDEFPLLHIDLRSHSECFSIEENKEWELKIYEQLMTKLKSLEVPTEKVLIISLRRSFIKLALARNCPYDLSLEEYGTFEEGLQFAVENKLQYLTMKPSKLTTKSSAKAHEKGIQIITFGAKSKSGNRKLLELNPDMIQSNNVSALNELLE